jgi:outer membrane protein OmpA-like peptidoglycan-associated protein
MRKQARIAARLCLVAGGSAAVLMTQGCIATRDWVKTQMDPVASQVSTNDGRLSQAERQLNALGGRVAGVETTLAGVEGKLGAVDARTEQALNALANLKVERRVVIDMKDGATFGFDSASLPRQAKKEIDVVLSDLKAKPGGMEGTAIVVAGHTDNAGSPDYNYELGQQRANAVARYLTTHTAKDQIQVIPVSYGESAPLLANSTAKGRAKNRRVEILVYRDEITTTPNAAAAQTQPVDPTPGPARLSQSR